MSCCSVAFAGSELDRADHIRSDPERLEVLKSPQASLLLLDGLAPKLDGSNGLKWGRLKDAPEGAELVFLGMRLGFGCFAAVPAEGSTDPAYSPQETMRRTWAAIGLMSAEDLAIYGGARSLVDWHARHTFCAKCGSPTVLAKGGWQRSCTNEACKAEHFPRVDPVTIMLVEHEGRLLLGRQPRFPPRRFSALAGFVEPGESVEEAVAREVLEEAGVKVRDVSYIASQPWPFPSQLMLGCHAFAESAGLLIDTTELEEAHWFTRDEIAAAMAGDETQRLLTPPPVAIAHHLLKWWLDQ
ncbi:MAG: NAD(+) diphosphatase [Novosphingobium sp.]|nr:NAD(+) diphosphatase [Novosphingobium sp.]MBO9601349.1 NAD(+) diphosphatase [Novosphingobium sp.]